MGLFSSVRTTWIIHSWLQLSQWTIWEKTEASLKAQHLLFSSPLSISWFPFDSRARSNPGYTTYWLFANLCDFHPLSSVKWVHSSPSFLLCMLLLFSHKSCPSFLWPHGLSPIRLLCPQDFLGKNTGVGCHFLFQGNFLTQGSNSGLLQWLVDSSTAEPPEKPYSAWLLYISNDAVSFSTLLFLGEPVIHSYPKLGGLQQQCAMILHGSVDHQSQLSRSAWVLSWGHKQIAAGAGDSQLDWDTWGCSSFSPSVWPLDSPTLRFFPSWRSYIVGLTLWPAVPEREPWELRCDVATFLISLRGLTVSPLPSYFDSRVMTAHPEYRGWTSHHFQAVIGVCNGREGWVLWHCLWWLSVTPCSS